MIRTKHNRINGKQFNENENRMPKNILIKISLTHGLQLNQIKI